MLQDAIIDGKDTKEEKPTSLKKNKTSEDFKKEDYQKSKSEFYKDFSEEAKKTFPFMHKNKLLEALYDNKITPEDAERLHGADYPELDFKKLKKDFETRQAQREERVKKIHENTENIEKIKKDFIQKEKQEKLQRYEEAQKSNIEKAKTETLEEYLNRKGVKARKGPVYELHKYDWEQANNSKDAEDFKQAFYKALEEVMIENGLGE